eukprot:CAMPEP_0174939348 /NCGR_PEP_ID=MMETSP1355-20121228/66289_1 /TAXON_ID=464990 /ORGANISM="Hemiselmis tepida, Strain CCMP443" /LENGTH=344 /DNA_ID=CAMNT_0016186359 /DNA_START=18 /DNA_END=1048 /DNA_ORIENTATION=+
MVDAPVTCKLLTHSIACHPPSLDKKKRISEAGPKWVDDKDVGFCQSCGFQFNVVIRRHHCRHCGNLFCRYCAQDRWPLPKFEYLHPVRVCRKCSRKCWKAEALLQAITNNDINSLVKYVQRKNDCNLHTGVLPPLHLAAAAGFSELCHVLLKGGAKVNFAVPPMQHTVLITCAYCNHTDAHQPRSSNRYECQRCHEVTNALDDAAPEAAWKGLSPSDHIGLTALHAAVKSQGHVDSVKHLLNAGARVDAQTHNGNTALLLAAACGHIDCCRVLVRSKANVNMVCEFDGDTPLHRAVREGHAKIVTLLIDHGAVVGHKNLEGLTAAQIAEKRKKGDILEALRARP